MKYNGQVSGNETVIVIEKEGIRFNDKLLDYADVESILPINHRIRIRTFSQGELEISMLGFSYDGFWEELMDCFESKDSLFDFSEMSRLISLVEEKADNFQSEIIESNKQKLTSLAKQSYNNINYIIESNKEKENAKN